MDRIKRNERLGVLLRILTQPPNRIHTLNEFCDLFGAAKSTVSEDIELLREALKHFDQGEITTVTGAAGGVKYRATMSDARAHAELVTLADMLSTPDRLLPGGFLYTSDVTANPGIVELLGQMLAQQYDKRHPHFVLTMETKGIPIALMTARQLDVPLVIARRDSRAYEGSAVKINYIAGGASDKIETMALSRRAVSPGQRALIIDDFMKGGGTLQGMIDMMREFQAEVVGVGVMIATASPAVKRVKGVKSLLVLHEADPVKGTVRVTPSDLYQKGTE